MGSGSQVGPRSGQWPTRLRLLPPDPNSPIWRARGLLVLTLAEDQISTITRFGDRGVLARFGLPRTLVNGTRNLISCRHANCDHLRSIVVGRGGGDAAEVSGL